MSWSVRIPTTPVADFGEVVDAAEPDTFGGGLKHEVAEQLVAAREAAKALLASGAIGDPTHVAATLAGHANDDHQITEGYTNDHIDVSIYHVTPPTPIEVKLAEQQPVQAQQPA